MNDVLGRPEADPLALFWPPRPDGAVHTPRQLCVASAGVQEALSPRLERRPDLDLNRVEARAFRDERELALR